MNRPGTDHLTIIPLASALSTALTVLDASTTGATQRLVVILGTADDLTDLGTSPNNPSDEAELLRTLGACTGPGSAYDGPPARISALRVSDGGLGSGSPNDPSCNLAASSELLALLSNTPNSSWFHRDQSFGFFGCAVVCSGATCGTTPPNCSYSQTQIDTLVSIVRRSICSLGLETITVTQQTQQSPGGTISEGGSVTLSVAATASPVAPTYQWRRDGIDYYGANGASFAISPADRCDAAVYDCVIRTTCDTETTNALQLVVSSSGDDCDNSMIADECEAIPLYDRTAALTNNNSSGSGDFDWARSIAVGPNGSVVYGGTILPNGGAAVDFELGPDCDPQIPSGIGVDGFITRLTMQGGVPVYDWTKRWTGTETLPGSARIRAVGIDSGGNIYAGGHFSDTVDFDPGAGTDIRTAASGLSYLFVTSVTSNGTYRWTRVIATDSDVSLGFGLTVDANDGVIFSSSYSGTTNFDPLGPGAVRSANGQFNPCVVKHASNGAFQWVHTIAGSQGGTNGTVGTGTGVVSDAERNVYVTGYVGAVASPWPDFNPAPRICGSAAPLKMISSLNNIFVMKLNSNGCYQWAKRMGSPYAYDAFGHAIAMDRDENLFITGAFKGTLNLDPDQQPDPDTCTTCDCNPATQPFCHVAHGESDIFVVKLRKSVATHVYDWSRTFGSPGSSHADDLGLGLSADAYGNAIITGLFEAAVDFDPTNELDCPEDPACRIPGKQDIFLTQWNKNGTFGWVHAVGEPSLTTSRGDDVAVDADGGIWVSGFFAKTVDFNPVAWAKDLYTGIGDAFVDAFVVRFHPPRFPFIDCDNSGFVDACDAAVCEKGDVNMDGLVNGKDIDGFMDCVLASSTTCPCADFDFSGFADFGDIACFCNHLVAGELCPITCGGGGGGRSFPDCDNNGTPDVNQIGLGTSLDCNTNSVPDECDIDEGDPDGNEEVSNDANTNSIPDECEDDCNSNGIPDDKDISDSTSDDCDTNGIPDECEPDCNTNSVVDACDVDIADPDGNSQVSADCDGNKQPDECQQDCNTNGVPDTCDLDPEDPDGDEWVSPDCNTNGFPDECDLAIPPGLGGELDCNTNGIPDSCDIASCESDPACDDCNNNAIPDSCDIAAQISQDANTNGIPDECEGEGFMGGGGGESMMSGGGEGGEESEGNQAEAWDAYYEWSEQQCWGPACETTGAEQFAALVAKLKELGLPVTGRPMGQ